MARKLRVLYPGAIYHVTIRGVERRNLFRDDRDRHRFLSSLEEAVEAYGVRIFLYCCMRNHVHLVVQTPQPNLTQFMHKLQTSYTVYFNRRHDRAGHLMQGRYHAIPVQGDVYLLRLSRYVHLNPVFVKPLADATLQERIAALRSYRWSSYGGYIGLREQDPFVTEEPILAQMGEERRASRREYRKFVEAGLARTDQEFHDLITNARWGIGDGEFERSIRKLHQEQMQQLKSTEDVSFRKTENVYPVDQVLELVAAEFGLVPEQLRQRRRNHIPRMVAAWILVRHCGLTQRQAGKVLEIGSGAAVCQQLRGLREHTTADPRLLERIQRLSSAVSKLNS